MADGRKVHHVGVLCLLSNGVEIWGDVWQGLEILTSPAHAHQLRRPRPDPGCTVSMSTHLSHTGQVLWVGQGVKVVGAVHVVL